MNHDNDNPELDGPAPTPSEMGEPDADDMGMGGMNSNEICVDLAALAMPDEKDQMEPPAVGDKVTANVEGTVSRIEGDKAYVTMEAVNGQKVAENKAAPSDEEEMAGLQQMAAAQPERY